MLYGHEFETVNAAAQKELVTGLLSDTYSVEESKALLDQNQVQYIFLDPRDPLVPRYLISMTPIYTNETVAIYRRP